MKTLRVFTGKILGWLVLAALCSTIVQAQALVDQGLPLEKLDAGYEWSGWYLSDEAYAYIQAHDAPLTADPVQYVIDPEYMVTFTPQPGYQVAQEWPFYSPFRPNGADELLLLKRIAGP